MAYKYKYDGEEEKQVETLTLDIIRKELLKSTFSQARIALFLSALVTLGIVSVILIFKNYSGDLSMLSYLIVYFAVAVILTIDLIVIAKSFYALSARKIKVVTREVTDLSEKYYAFDSRLEYRRRSGYYYIHFKQYGKFLLPRSNYSWSKIYDELSDAYLYERTYIGDTFYLAILGDKKIGMVYNTKLFKYEGNIDK